MNLFSKIYSALLIGIIGLLIIVGNLHYEAQIRQFDADMAANALAVGRVLAPGVARAWVENGAEVAIRQLLDTDQADPEKTIRWVWFDEVQRKFAEKIPELRNLDWSGI